MKKIVMIAIVLIASFSLNAQNQIEGKVLGLSNDGEIIPIFGANVYWEGTNVGTVTDIKGMERLHLFLGLMYIGRRQILEQLQMLMVFILLMRQYLFQLL